MNQRFIVLMLVSATLMSTGCSSNPKPSQIFDGKQSVKETLWALHLRHKQQLRFEGILLVRHSPGDFLDFSLLDATGITLIEAQMDSTGEKNIRFSMAFLKKHDLPSLFLDSIYKIFIIQPSRTSCHWYRIPSLCSISNEKPNKGKRAMVGPVPLWDVIYLYANGRMTQALLRQLWIDIEIRIVALE